ncbi:MAG: hypothetical protein PVH19_07290 [Planctomycetia bacterium]
MATSPKFHPAVRFNAAVMIGRLDSKRIASRRYAEPYPGALDILVPLLENQDENDAARFGAMLGIIRHARFSKDAASRPKILKVLVAQADNSTLPPGQTLSKGQQWFRTTAVEGLAYATGDEINTVAPVLAKIINDKTEPDTLRLVAANSLGKLKLTPNSGANAVVTIRSLAELATEAVRQEVEACEKDPIRTIAPDQLLTKLVPIRMALSGSEKHVSAPNNGLAPAAEDKEFLRKVYKLVDDWCRKLDNKELLPEDMLPTSPLMQGEKPPARVATEEIIDEFKLDLQKMDNLLGVGGNPPS